MNKDELIEFLRRHVDFLQGRLDEALASVNSLTLANDKLVSSNEKLTATVEGLKRQIASLEDVIKGKGAELSKAKAAQQAMQRLQGSSSERQKPSLAQPGSAKAQAAPKKKTNNGARRKEHLECKVVIVDKEPDDPDFDPEQASLIGMQEVVRYSIRPACVIKTVYRLKAYSQDGKIYKAEGAPSTPLVNSQYDSSFIAGLVELRYLHGMPLENVAEYIQAHGFDLDKGTAQKLVTKIKPVLHNLYKALGKAVIDDNYICGDETYMKVRLETPTTSTGKKIKKGYVWVFVGMTTGLTYFFYDDGSRSAQVFEKQIKGFAGAFQCDYYSGYRHIGIGDMSDIHRLPCIQHIKRKFLDLKTNPQAQDIARHLGLLYHFEHKHKIGVDGWTEDDHLKWRQRYSSIVLEKTRLRLDDVIKRTDLPPDDPLLAATKHAIKQWEDIKRIFASPIYRLDNNEVERANRHISLPRRRLTAGSHTGAETAAVYYSLAVSCERCGANFYDYLCDIIQRCAMMPPNTPVENYRDLLPDRWVKAQQ